MNKVDSDKTWNKRMMDIFSFLLVRHFNDKYYMIQQKQTIHPISWKGKYFSEKSNTIILYT